jgi:hypothetical protein
MEIVGDALNAALAQAVLNAFKPETMTEVFRESLREYLFAPQKTQYGVQASPFSQAFQKSLDLAARKVAEEFLAQPEQVTRMQKLLSEAFNQAISDPEYKKRVVERFSRAFGF